MQRSSRCFAEPGPYQTPALITAPALQRTVSPELRAALRPGHEVLGLLLDGVRLARARGEDCDRFLDRFDGAFGGARAMSDQIVGAVEVEPADLADPRRDQQVR